MAGDVSSDWGGEYEPFMGQRANGDAQSSLPKGKKGWVDVIGRQGARWYDVATLTSLNFRLILFKASCTII